MKKAIRPQTIESWFTKAGVERQREIDAADKRLGVSFFPPDWRERLAARDKKNKK